MDIYPQSAKDHAPVVMVGAVELLSYLPPDLRQAQQSRMSVFESLDLGLKSLPLFIDPCALGFHSGQSSSISFRGDVPTGMLQRQIGLGVQGTVVLPVKARESLLQAIKGTSYRARPGLDLALDNLRGFQDLPTEGFDLLFQCVARQSGPGARLVARLGSR